MEMPIAVMITLFVCIIVAVAVISFSREVLIKSKDNVNKIGPDDDLGTKIVAGSGPTLFYDLAVQCAKDSQGKVDRDLCFVVKTGGGSSTPSQSSFTADGRDFTIEDNSGGGATAVFIYYDPLGKIVFEK
ncbi:MAG: hypothetical protein V1866_04530 [archaeon]